MLPKAIQPLMLNPSTATATPPAARSDPAASAVDVRDLSFSYGDRVALDSLSLAVPSGTIFGLLGPNGSGKSTLLSLLTGRRAPASGSIRVLGEPLSARLRARLGVVFQEPSLDPNMTVSETIALQTRLFSIPHTEARRRIESLLERVGLSDRAGSMTPTLSGGMQRRLELARALVTRPELLLLDEPTLALDPDSRQTLWQHLLEASASGCTLILATNDVYEAERYCQTVALLDRGRLIAQGTPAELKRDLRREAVRIEWKGDAALEAMTMQGWPGVGGVRVSAKVTHVTVDEASTFLARLFQSSGDRVSGVTTEPSTLEDVYFQLVGHGISPRPDGDGADE